MVAGLTTTSSPSVNFTPWMIFGNWLWPSSLRQVFCAPSTSLKTSSELQRFGEADADIVLYGHTHRQVVRRVGRVLVVNPGGLPRQIYASNGVVKVDEAVCATCCV